MSPKCEPMMARGGRNPALLGTWLLCALAAPALADDARPVTLPQFAPAHEGLPRDGLWKSVPVLADFNGDGHLDIAAHPRLAEGTRVWLGDGKGHWQESSQGLLMEEGSCGGGLETADLNGDGHPDLAVADHCNGVYVYLGDGKGRWQAVARELNPAKAAQSPDQGDVVNPYSGAEDLGVGDVDGDGHPDLVVAASDKGGFTVYLGNGSGSHWQEVRTPDGLPSSDDPEPDDDSEGGWVNRLTLQDLDGDGHLDVAASYYAGPRVWYGDGSGQWRPGSQGLPKPVVGGLFRGLTVGDANGDGRTDLLVANIINGPELFLQQQDGSWQATPDLFPDMLGGAETVALADLNGDGHADILVGGLLQRDPTASYGLYILLGDGQGRWRRAGGLPETGLEVTWGIEVADLDEDGRPDLAVSTGGSNGSPADPTDLPHLQIWLNRSPGLQLTQAAEKP